MRRLALAAFAAAFGCVSVTAVAATVWNLNAPSTVQFADDTVALTAAVVSAITTTDAANIASGLSAEEATVAMAVSVNAALPANTPIATIQAVFAAATAQLGDAMPASALAAMQIVLSDRAALGPQAGPGGAGGNAPPSIPPPGGAGEDGEDTSGYEPN